MKNEDIFDAVSKLDEYAKVLSNMTQDELIRKMMDMITTMELSTEDPEARKRYEHLRGLYGDKE